MATTPTEHRAKIAEARNVLGEVISRARYAGEPTVLVNRGKEAAVVVSYGFYEHGRSITPTEVTLWHEVRDRLYRLVNDPVLSKRLEELDPDLHLLLDTGGLGY